MLEIFKNLFGKKTPEGVIKLNDLHFIACGTGANMNTITWDNIKKELKVFHINDNGMKEMYRKSCYDLSEYGYIEVFNNHKKGAYLKARIEHKAGYITGFAHTEEFLETPSNIVITEG